MKTQEEIEKLRDEALHMPEFPGLTYKEGVIFALEWVLKRTQDKPTE